MGADLDFRILGPLEVVAAGAPLPVGHGQQRLLLAILLLSANEVVSTDRIVDELWPSGPPAAARTALHGHVSALRKVLGRDRVVTRPPGYLVRVEDDELDLTRFERLLADARAASNPRSRADALSHALALWRGMPLGDVPQEGAVPVEARRLEERRLVALEDRIDADLALGREAELVPELERLVSQHPLRERPRAQLMLALYRSGRQADALQAYRDTRQMLVEEIGIEPGPALKGLELRILAQDPELARDLEAQEISAPPAPPEPRPRRGSRKRVTVLFAAAADAEGDPESAGRLAARYFDAARPVLERHEARVERVMGDSLLAVFGIPRLHDDDAVRAVRAAAELRGVLGAVAARIGIATGEVFVDDSEADGVFVTGEPVRLAARVQAAAAPGEILIAEETRAVVHHAVVVEPIGPERSGSKAPVWRLGDVLPGAPGVARHLDAPLVGRERELADLERALDRVLAERTSHLFTLLGPAGIGKSRLAGEFTVSAAPRAQTLVGRCQPYGEGITYWPLAEMVRQLAGESPREGLARLLAGDLHAETVVDRILGAVGEGASRPTSEEISWAASRLIETVARARPLVVVFEDLHWAEPTFLDLVEHFADWVRDAPVLLLCLARLELLDERRSWPGGKLNATTALLETLSREESARLLANADQDDQLDVPARERLVEAAGGNPLFLEQMAAAARGQPSGGALVRPTTIDALLAARLERLARGERTVIECAAVQGAEFDRNAVEELLPADLRPETAGWLAALVAKDLIRPTRSPTAGDAFRFRHELIREAAYDGSAKATRTKNVVTS